MKDKPMFTGCGTAMVTPFKNGEVDFDAFSELVRRQLEAGMHFLVPLATTGETPCLENDEKLQLLVRCREIVDDYEQRTGRSVPVVVGAGRLDPPACRDNLDRAANRLQAETPIPRRLPNH